MADEPIEIEELREAGEDGGSLMGYFCRGHVDRDAFARAANAFSGAASSYDARHVRPERCFHVWWRTEQMPGQPAGTYHYRAVAGPGAGAWPATVCECIEESRLLRARREVQADRSGHRRGMAEGVQWALNTLDGMPDARDRLLAAWRARKEPSDA